MYCLTAIDSQTHVELENELKHFFHRVHTLKHRLKQEQGSLVLNRLQRVRCKENLLRFETLESEFYAITYRDDIRELYRKVQRYVKLDHDRLMHTFGTEHITRTTLFVSI